MSFIVSGACVRIKAPGVAKNVLMQLAEISNDDGYAWPSIETLCMRTCWSRTAVIEAIAWLEQNGAIQPDRTNGRKTHYWVTPHSFIGEWYPPPKDEEKRYRKRTGTPAAPVRQPHRTGTPAAPDRYASRTLIPGNTKEPSNPPLPPSGEGPRDGVTTQPTDAANGFDAVAALYPKRAGIEAARRDWRDLQPSEELQAEILRAVRAWQGSEEWRRSEGRYIPKLGKFLRDQRWLDAPGAGPVAAAPAPTPAPVRVLTQEELKANGAKARAAVAAAKQLLQGRKAA